MAKEKTFPLIARGNKKTPAWCYNLEANPKATCWVEGQVGDYSARQAFGEEYARYWEMAKYTYAGFGNYKQRVGGRYIPIWVLEPLVHEE